VWLGKGDPPATTGLWWCRAKAPSGELSDWGTPIQIMTAQDRGWHAGPWKPCLRYDDRNPRKMFVFFDGSYSGYVFTLGCLEMQTPE